MKNLLRSLYLLSCLIVCLLGIQTKVNAQLVVSAPPAGPNYTALVQNFFVGQGVTISNVTYAGSPNAIGSFSSNSTNLGLAGGIIMTTGNRTNAIGPNNAAGAGTNLNGAGLPELTALAGATTYDGAALQFDFVAQSSTVSFQYIWASEEYPEYVNAGYNDAFAFFISGPGFGAATNIALIPGTTTPITIDNVNGNLNSQYYVNNAGGSTIQYDGFTTTLTATATVIPCQTYTLRLVIADAGDHIFDSAVFLGQNSLSSTIVSVSAGSGYSGSNNAAYEGCLPGYLNFTIPTALSTDFTFTYSVGGTATNGVDYQAIPTSVTIPAGQTSAQIVINAINDNITEGQETIIIGVNNPCSVTTSTVYINDIQPLAIVAGADILQCGNPTPANLTSVASGGLTPYVYSWSNGTGVVGTTANISNTPTGTTTYTVTVTGACPGQLATDQQVVAVATIPTSAFTASAASVCNGQPLTATYNGNATSGATYNWSVNNGATISGSGQSVSINYPGANTYTISLTVSQNGCTSTTTTTVPVTVYAQPNSPFTAPATLCTAANGTFNFTGIVITGAAYTWNFNGGTIVSGSGAGSYQVNWATAGTKTVTLTVAANGCSSTTNATVNVVQTPTSTFMASSPLCTGVNGTITYTGAVIPGATYTWNFNGGTVVAGSGVGPYTVNWATAGTKNVTLTVSAGGCSSTLTTVPVVVNSIPFATFTSSGSPVCYGQPVTVTSSNPGATTYTWSVNNGASISGSGQGPVTINYPAAGTYNVSLAVTSNGCTSAASTSAIVVNPMPTSGFTVSNTQFCAGASATITYSGTPITGAAYSWNFNGGTVVSGSGVGPYTVNWATAGVKNITLSVSAAGCVSPTTTVPVTINPIPTSTFTTSGNNVCAGTAVNMTYSGNASPGATYTWAANNGATVTGTNHTLNYPAAGTYNVTLSVTENGCTSTTTTVPVVINPMPTSGFTVSNTQFCAGASATITYSGTPITGAAFSWNFNGGTVVSGSGVGPYTVTWSTVGVKNITLSVSAAGCVSPTTTVPVTVNQVPTSTFTPSGTSVCNGTNVTMTYTGNALPGASFAWTANNGATVTGSNHILNYPSVGTYNVSLSVSENGCLSTTTVVPVTINPQPVANISAATPLCTGVNGSITYNAVPVSGAVYTWGFNGGTVASGSGLGPYQVNWPTPGTKTVTLTVAASGCSASTSAPVVVNQMPTSSFTVSSAQLCTGSGATVTFTGTVATGASYTWDFAGATVVSGSGVGPYQLTWNAPGIKNITLAVSANGCNSTITTIPVTIYQSVTSTFTVSATTACAGTPVTMTYTGNASQSASYSWSANNGATITGTNHTLNYPGPGTYNVSLTVAENGCSSSSTTIPVTINAQPTANFTATNPLCTGVNGPITYNGTQLNGATYTWNFNGGSVTSGTGAGPYLVNWTNAGTKNVSLTVDAAGCSATSTVPVIVNQVPNSNFSVNGSQFCTGAIANVTYNAVPVSGAVYTWNFNGGTIASGSGLGPYTISWSTPGPKVISLTVSANGCNSTTTTVPVNVNQTPTSTFTVSAGSVCDGQAVTLNYTGNATPGATYNWTVNNNGTVSGNNPFVFNYAGPNSYSISLTVIQNGCSSTAATLPVVVKPQPTAIFTTTTPLCTGQNGAITFTGNQVTGAVYTWGFNGGTIASGSGMGPYQVNWASAGTKNVTLTVAANGCSATSASPVVVNQMPTSTFTISNTQFCTGNNANITYTGAQVQNAVYTWNFAGGIVLAGSSFGPYQISWPTPGLKNVTLNVAANGCASPTTVVPVTINPIPTSTFVPSASNVCMGTPVTMSYSGSGTNGASYTWSASNGATVTGPSHNLNYPGPGVYNVSLTVAENGCTSTTTTIPVTVYAIPTANFTVQGPVCEGASANVLYTGNASGSAQYAWDWDGGTATNITGQNYSVQYPLAGTYAIMLNVTQNGCTSATIEHNIVVNPIPASTFIATSPVCTNEGSVVTYTGNAPTGSTYQWSFDGGTVASGQNQGPYTINWTTAGTKDVKLIVTSNGCASLQTIVPVVVNARPTADFTVSAGSACLGQPVTITYSGTGSPAATYNWSATNGATVTNTNGNTYQFGYPGPGTYNITLSVTENGCASATPVTVPVTINNMPTSAFIASANPICNGQPLSLAYTGNATQNATYTWNTTGGVSVGNPTQGSYPVTYPGPGNYTVSLTVTENGCSSTLTSLPIVVNPTPTSGFLASNNPVCNGSPVVLTYNGNATPNATYVWEASNGSNVSFISQGSYNFTYPGQGSFIVKLTVNENGCTSTQTSDTIDVFDVPVSAFAAVQNPVCDGQPVTLVYGGQPIPGAVYTWTTPDSVYIDASGLNSYDVSYPGAGTYNVSLRVTANGCPSDSTTLPIIVNANPDAPFNASLTLCAGANGNVVYTGPQLSGNSYQWGFDGGNVNSGSGYGPYSVTWTDAGTKNVTLIVTAANGCSSDTAAVPVVVNPVPASSFTASTPLCTGVDGSIYYTGAPVSGAQYTWFFDGANVLSGTNYGPYQLNWNTPGTKMVSLTVSANGCTSLPTIQPVTVNLMPTSPFTATDTTVCFGEPITLVYTGNASPAANYVWFTTGGANVTGTGNGPFNVEYPSAGTFYLTLTVDQNGCSSQQATTVPVTITPLPQVNFTVPVGECLGVNSYNFMAQGQFTFQAAIDWSFGANASPQVSYVINPTNVSFDTIGAYPITLTVTDNGCTASHTEVVEVYPDPQVVFVADEIRGCSPLEVQFSDLSGYGAAATYSWSFGDGDTSTLQNPLHLYTQAGTYSVSLQITFSSACGGSITQSEMITVYPIPTAGFTATPTVTDMFNPIVTVTGTIQGATACYYTMGDGDTLQNTISGSHEYTAPGFFTITQYVTNGFGCGDTAEQVVRIDPQFAIYVPNAFTPNNDGINDAFGAKGLMVNNFTMYIFNRWGEKIFIGEGIDDYWDGSDRSGKKSPKDVYVYKIYYSLPNGDTKAVLGTVALVD